MKILMEDGKLNKDYNSSSDITSYNYMINGIRR